MKKLFLLSSISVFIGLMFLVFCTSQVYAKSPFEVPPKGGLPVCMEDLDLCNSDLDTCDADLAACEAAPGQIFPGDGYPNPDAFDVSGHGPALSYRDNGDGTFTDDITGFYVGEKGRRGGVYTTRTMPIAGLYLTATLQILMEHYSRCFWTL